MEYVILKTIYIKKLYFSLENADRMGRGAQRMEDEWRNEYLD